MPSPGSGAEQAPRGPSPVLPRLLPESESSPGTSLRSHPDAAQKREEMQTHTFLSGESCSLFGDQGRTTLSLQSRGRGTEKWNQDPVPNSALQAAGKGIQAPRPGANMQMRSVQLCLPGGPGVVTTCERLRACRRERKGIAWSRPRSWGGGTGGSTRWWCQREDPVGQQPRPRARGLGVW